MADYVSTFGTGPQIDAALAKVAQNTAAITALASHVDSVEGALSGRISTLENAGFITISVDNLVNYYTKSQVYTKSETAAVVDSSILSKIVNDVTTGGSTKMLSAEMGKQLAATDASMAEQVSQLGQEVDTNNHIYLSPTPNLVLKHIQSNGSIASNDNKNACFENPIIALKGSYFYVDDGYKYQYAVYNYNTESFIRRVQWAEHPPITKITEDCKIRLEISTVNESVLEDTSIFEHFHFILYSDQKIVKDFALVTHALEPCLKSKEYSLLRSEVEMGSIYNGYNISSDNSIRIPVDTKIRASQKIVFNVVERNDGYHWGIRLFEYDRNGNALSNWLHIYYYFNNIPSEYLLQNSNTFYVRMAFTLLDNTNTPVTFSSVSDKYSDNEIQFQIIEPNIYTQNEADAIIQELSDSNEYKQFLLCLQSNNIINSVGVNTFKDKLLTISSPDKYSAWPRVGKVGDRLVCLYTKQLEHYEPMDGGTGAIYSSVSPNGFVWTPPKLVIDTPNKRDGVTGGGNDSNGNMLFLNRVGTTDNANSYYEVYKTTDGFAFSKISTIPKETRLGHCGDIINVPTRGLMAFFGTPYSGSLMKWGYILSEDNGVTWTAVTVEDSLAQEECPMEMSAVYLGDGKIIVVGRYEGSTQDYSKVRMYQMQSDDYGATWTKYRTNIEGSQNTPSLVSSSDYLHLYIYNRTAGKLEYREIAAGTIWGNPTAWPNATTILTGTTGNNVGNVSACRFNSIESVSFYSGDNMLTGIYNVIH